MEKKRLKKNLLSDVFLQKGVSVPFSIASPLRSFHNMLLMSFMIFSVFLILFLSSVLYAQFSIRLRMNQENQSEQLLKQGGIQLEEYLLSMRRISDALYYNVVKGTDVDYSKLNQEMNLLYEAHKDSLVSVALFSAQGKYIAAVPISSEKKNRKVTEQDWYREAVQQVENLHFSLPHVQNLFDDPSYRTHWVISLSRVVELNFDGRSDSGVLLVDMDYNMIERMMEKLNQVNGKRYFYLCDKRGKLIYHPKIREIYRGHAKEDTELAVAQEDGIHRLKSDGKEKTIVVDTIGYTGWKLVSVLEEGSNVFATGGMLYYVFIVISVTLLIALVMNQVISLRLSYPIRKLNEDLGNMGVKRPTMEEISSYGSTEIVHLGESLLQSLQRIDELTEERIRQQEEKRQSEMDALQSQINPHFLYNTLESVVWMIESGKREDAVFMVTQLASFFRISLSAGKNIIPLSQEIQHAKNYMNIQKIRFKNKFTVDFDVEEEVLSCLTVKLILQPILENAIYHGMEGMDEDGEILVSGRILEEEDGRRTVLLSVKDNGFGMTEDKARALLEKTESDYSSFSSQKKRGSGVGVINVHRRIQLRFGSVYGLRVISAPDEGTDVQVLLPAIPFTEENQKSLEHGNMHHSTAHFHSGSQEGEKA